MSGKMPENPVVQFLVMGLNPAWRMLSEHERSKGREEMLNAIHSWDDGITTYSYSLVGIKAGADVLLWRVAGSIDQLQESYAAMTRTGLGRYLEARYIMTGLVRQSTYVKKPTAQEQAILEQNRKRYLIVYPFTKTAEWYLLKRDTRQGIMNEHIRVGREFPTISQVLVYSFGLDDQEFIVAYETDDLKTFQDCVIALRETEARRYTLRDTPIFTAIHRPLEEVLELLG